MMTAAALLLTLLPPAPGGGEIGLVPIVRATRPPAIDGQAEEAWSG